MPYTEIVEVTLHKPIHERLHGCFIDAPKAGQREEADAVDVLGWALEKDGPAAGVELLSEGRVIRRVPMNHTRPDLAKGFPKIPRAERGGFQARAGIVGMGSPEWLVQAVLQDQTRVPIGVIRTRRCWREERTGAEGTALVSIIVTNCGQSAFLGETIDSSLAQTYVHLEIILVDDGAADAVEIARHPAVQRVQPDGMGLAAARNTGIRWSNGSYLVFLNAGDRLLPDALATGIETMKQHPTCALAAGTTARSLAGEALLGEPDPLGGEPDHFAVLLRGDHLWPPAAVLHCREVIEHVVGFEPHESPVLDYDLYLRVARDFPVCSHGQLVAEHRADEQSERANAGLLLQSALGVLRGQRKFVKGDEKRKQAYRDGLRRWRERYAESLVGQIQAQLGRGERKQAARALKILSRCHPEKLASLLNSQGL